MAPVNTVIRENLNLRSLVSSLRRADSRLNESIEKLEDMFELRLSEGSHGCMLLESPRILRGVWTHAVYDDGVFWIDQWSSMGVVIREDLLKWDIRAHKLEFCRRADEMWVLCGGDPALVGRKSTDSFGIGQYEPRETRREAPLIRNGRI